MSPRQFHRAVPVSKGLDDNRPGTEWRCCGCGATTEHEGDLDDERCPALHFLLDDPEGVA